MAIRVHWHSEQDASTPAILPRSRRLLHLNIRVRPDDELVEAAENSPLRTTMTSTAVWISFYLDQALEAADTRDQRSSVGWSNNARKNNVASG